ncbi:hypothetical protein B0H19DRAFT_294250 [Mycena capillaripes]|nr:hypothetical protein B0H19DRAFT_294250 [Mycena capillaripes]
MSSCPTPSYDQDSPPESIQVTTIATITSSTPHHSTHSHNRPIHVATTETVDEIIVVNVKTAFASSGTKIRTDSGFVTSRSTMSTSASTTRGFITSSAFASFVIPTSVFPSTPSISVSSFPTTVTLSSSVPSSVSAIASASVLGPNDPLQPPASIDNSSSSAENGTLLQAGASSTSRPLRMLATSHSVAAVFGVVIAGILVLTLVVLLLVLWARRRSARAAHNAGGACCSPRNRIFSRPFRLT